MAAILILGESGQLATALRALSWPTGTKVSSLGRRDLGTGDTAAAAAAAAIRRTRPHLVLNAAAYTAVDRAEAEPALAHALNAELPLAAAQACAELGIPLVHVSTDYVFDGEKATAYLETDPANPLSIYGASKLAGDINIESVAAADGWRRPTRLRWAILRSSWVFSGTGDSFPAKLLARARAGETLRVVDDQTGCPTTASALAQAMQAVGRRLLDGDNAAAGLFNFCGAAAMSWHGFAGLVLDAAQRGGMTPPPLVPVASADYPAAARRPRRSVLDCGKIARHCGLMPRPIDDELDRIVRAILAR